MADDMCDELSDELRNNFNENGIFADDGNCSPVERDVLKFERSKSESNSEGSCDATMLVKQVESASVSSTADDNGILDERLIESGISNLSWSADGTKQVYLHLSVPGSNIRDIGILKSYIHLQKVHLPHNQIEDLSVLGNMPHLLELDASNNSIKTLLGFTAPKNLVSINLSFNEISEIGDLSEHHALQYLFLDNNKVAEIKGLENCKRLVHLSLKHNRIAEISGLDNLPLKYLSLSCNQLTRIENLESVKYLQVVELAGNKICNLSGLEHHDFLETIDLEDNNVIDIAELEHVQGLGLLRSLNLLRNPVQELPDYRLNLLLHLPQLTTLDRERVLVQEKVEAVNAFMPSMEYLASRDHMMHVVYSFLQPARVLDITLPVLDTPYPMLVLVGPQGMGKRNLALKLVEEFPDYFGYAASHTTRLPRADEALGKDYHFISMDEFEEGIKQGRFLQACSYQGEIYGLTLDAVELVACESLACVVHMELEGVLSLKKSYLEPRYVLLLPSNTDSFQRHLMLEGYYAKAQIDATMERVELYRTYNQSHPGFFDATISSGDIVETYHQLRQLVMEYLGIAIPATALTRTTTDLDRDYSDLSVGPEMEGALAGVQKARAKSAPVLKYSSWSRPTMSGLVGSAKVTRTPPAQFLRPPSARGKVEEKSLQNRFSLARDALSSCSSAAHKQMMPRSCPESAASGVSISTNHRSVSAPSNKLTFDILLLDSSESSSAESKSRLSNSSNNINLGTHDADNDEPNVSLRWSADPVILDTRLDIVSATNPRSVRSAGLPTPRPTSGSASEPFGSPTARPVSGSGARPGSGRHRILPPIGGQA